jgi:hypothetical protein
MHFFLGVRLERRYYRLCGGQKWIKVARASVTQRKNTPFFSAPLEFQA